MLATECEEANKEEEETEQRRCRWRANTRWLLTLLLSEVWSHWAPWGPLLGWPCFLLFSPQRWAP